MKRKTVQEWIAECRTLPKRDLDNFMLFTGPEGSGKSTVAFQVMVALLRGSALEFDMQNVAFSIPEFIEIAKLRDPLGDEFLANKRKGMWGDTVDLLDFLQVCRGLNRHLAVCFPHPELLDEAIWRTRVRYWIHVPRRGYAVVRERIVWFHDDGTMNVGWPLVCDFNFKRNTGPLWRAYLARKRLVMEGRSLDTNEDEASPEGWDISGLRGLPGAYEEARGSPRGKL